MNRSVGLLASVSVYLNIYEADFDDLIVTLLEKLLVSIILV
jgi:hypothetical protein